MALEDQIIGAESGGNPTAKNPLSSATGAGQFIDGTWLAMIGKHRPDLAGLPRDQVLALRNDPDLSREMTGAYAAENAAGLRSSGFDPTPGNTYLAHFAGLGGARSVLGADPSTPVAAVLPPKSIAANSFLGSMTAGQLIDWASRKVGGSAPIMQTPGASAASGRFTPSGIVASSDPAPTMQAPPAEDRPPIDAASILKAVMAGQSAESAPAGGLPASTPPMLAPIRSRAAPFNAKQFFELLTRR